jgi:hypothetical protein
MKLMTAGNGDYCRQIHLSAELVLSATSMLVSLLAHSVAIIAFIIITTCILLYTEIAFHYFQCGLYISQRQSMSWGGLGLIPLGKQTTNGLIVATDGR